MLDQSLTRKRQAEISAEACSRLLKERFGARQVYVVGSLAGQSPWHSRSDIDLAVEGLAPEEYFPALSALWELLPEGLDLDLITLENAPPEIARRITGETVRTDNAPENSNEGLKEEIATELLNLTRIVDEAKAISGSQNTEPTSIEIRAAGSIIHDFYGVVERIFERIAVRLGPGLPAGDSWHTFLLRSMELEARGIRAAVIDHELASRLVDYLRFRHLFRHSYGYELQWQKLRPLIQGLGETLELLRSQLAKFTDLL
ncbi:MAG TPA: nucleotidyltransferase domain-containing protein [Blastocatellia bacterium]|nr:nucleotidyltransferase domain-containing protein [Blastocatellia bacterium]